MFCTAPLRKIAATAVVAAITALAAGAASATALYSNFNPTVVGPGEYSATDYADISGYCANVYCTGWFNIFSAGFSFTAETTGVATRAYLPLQAISQYPGSERFYRISISDSQGRIVVQGGLLGRYVPLGQMAVYEFDLNRDYEAGQSLAPSDVLEAGETYTAYFHQRFGPLSQTHWMSSNEVPTAGQATEYCRLNTGAVGCASYSGSGWVQPWGDGVYQRDITDFLPALALTDGAGYTVNDVPEPTTLALVFAGLAAAGLQRRRGAAFKT